MGKIIVNGNNYTGGNANVLEVTQAEYDALPETKNSDGIIYAIEDAEADIVKPIEADYDAETKTVSLSGVNNKVAKFESGLSNIIKSDGFVHSMDIPISYGYGAGFVMGVYNGTGTYLIAYAVNEGTVQAASIIGVSAAISRMKWTVSSDRNTLTISSNTQYDFTMLAIYGNG